MAQTDEKVLEAVEKQLQKNPEASLDELLAVAKQVNSAIGRLGRRQFNARYPLQIKRRLQREAAAGKGTRKRRPSKGRKKAPSKARKKAATKGRKASTGKKRGPGRPKGSKTRKVRSAPAVGSGGRDEVRAVLLRFATDVVSQANSPTGLVKVMAEVDKYVDRIQRA